MEKGSYKIYLYLVVLLIIFGGTAYILLDDIKNGAKNNNSVNANIKLEGDIELKYDSNLDNSYDFVLYNYEEKDVSYVIYLRDDADTMKNCISPCKFINYTDIKYSLIKDTIKSSFYNVAEDRIIDYGVINGNKSISYRISLDNESIENGNIYSGKLEVSGFIK